VAWTRQGRGLPACRTGIFPDRLGLERRPRPPVILSAGDNEGTDGHRAKPRRYEPLERLTKRRQRFFQGDQSRGQRAMRLSRQGEDASNPTCRENVRWTSGRCCSSRAIW
jgi:hypothetical protein